MQSEEFHSVFGTKPQVKCIAVISTENFYTSNQPEVNNISLEFQQLLTLRILHEEYLSLLSTHRLLQV